MGTKKMDQQPSYSKNGEKQTQVQSCLDTQRTQTQTILRLSSETDNLPNNISIHRSKAAAASGLSSTRSHRRDLLILEYNHNNHHRLKLHA